jgi:hypothetical protein
VSAKVETAADCRLSLNFDLCHSNDCFETCRLVMALLDLTGRNARYHVAPGQFFRVTQGLSIIDNVVV